MSYAKYAAKQARQQRALWSFKRLRPLDFSPFALALRAFKPQARRISKCVSGKSVAELRALLDSGALTSVELTLHYLAQIKAQATLNAVLELNPDALALAADCDNRRGARGALHGIPVLIKDNIGSGDKMHTSAGAAVLRDAHSDRDAFLVTRLRAAGAVLLGKTNLSEWANFFADTPPPNGFSAVGGQTRNPHGPFDVGGSSSGSGSAVAAGLCAVAVGTETHGSIVYPSQCNGIFGLKPSLGLISRDRIVPITAATDTAGPMARNSADLALLMNTLCARDAGDPACVVLSASARGKSLISADFTQFLDAKALQGARIGVLPSSQTNAEILKSYRSMRAGFEKSGATLVDVTVPKFKIPFLGILNHGFVHGVADYLQMTSAPVKRIAEVVAFNTVNLAERAPNGMGRMKAALHNRWTPAYYAATIKSSRAKARAHIDTLMRKFKVNLLVTLDPDGHDCVFVMAGAPLLAVPAGRYTSGQPFGFTLAGRWLEDGALLAAAHAYAQCNSS